MFDILGFRFIFCPRCFSATPVFDETTIDVTTSGDVKAAGDINNDGFPDVIMGGAEMSWYEYPAWTKHTIATAIEEFTTDMQVVDVDLDGDLDIVTAEFVAGSNVIWLENPLPSASPATTPWTRHVIGSHGTWAHDIEVGDVDRDGKVDVIARKANTSIIFQDTPTTWTQKDITSAVGGDEGLGIGDVDRDGDIDLVADGAWIENPTHTRTGTWTVHAVASGFPADTTGTVADINGDTRPDIVFIGQHARGKFAWYEGPADPFSGAWIEHVVDTAMGSHKLSIGDVDRDGRLDIVAGLELLELAVYTQAPDTTFTKTIVSTVGTHNQRLVDIGSDGDLDIFGANWIGNPPTTIWENVTNFTASLDQWTYVEVTGSHSQTFGLNFGDMDNDGKRDIVSGQHWYKNPGGDLTGAWTQSAALPNAIEAMLVGDVDGDALADVIGQKTEGSVLALYWLEAANTSGTSWNAVRMGDVPATSHVLGAQGYRFADLRSGGRPEIVTSSSVGIWYFTIPLNPAVDPWTKVQVNANPSDEGFGAADIDHDGDIDIAAGTGDTKLVEWYRNPGTGLGNWQSFTIGNMNEAVYPDRFAVADLNGDNRPDIIGTEENGVASGAQTFWWEAPADPTTANWVRHALVAQGSTNAMDIGDIDRDGDIDIVLGEHKGSLKTAVWQNSGTGAFTEHVVGSGKEAHLGARVVDIDQDGDDDLVSIAYDTPQFIHLYRNDASGIPTPPDTTSPVISGVSATSIASASANIVWTTDEAANGQVEYGTTAAYGQLSTLQSALTQNHDIALPNLTANTLYHYRVHSADGSGNTSVSGDFTFTTTNQPALPGLVAAYNFNAGSGTTAADFSGNNITGTLVNGPSWTTAGKNDGALSFDGANDYVNLGASSALQLPGSFTLSAWVYPTTFSGDRDIITRVSAVSSEYHLQTTGTQIQVGFSSGGSWYYQNASTASMPLNAWSHVVSVFDDANNTFTMYINGVLQGTQSVAASPAPSTNETHIGMGWTGQSWSGKIDDVRVYNRALIASEIATDMNTPVGGPVVDTTPPVRTNGAPTGTLPETTTQATLSLVTDENATCKYGTTANTAYAAMTAVMGTTGGANHSTAVTVTAGTAYTYFVRCEDTAGNQNTTDYDITFAVAAPDTVAPTVSITSPANGAIVAGTVAVAANASDDRGVASVEFSVDAVSHATDTTTPFTANVDTLLLSEGTHTLSARALDAAGNENTATVTVTVQNTDTVVPSMPTNLLSTAVSTTQINLAWNASTDNVGVTGYRIWRNGVSVATTTVLSYQDTGLTPSTAYTYAVSAFDAAGNESALSATASATTLTPDTTAPVISAITAAAITTTGATITWTTNEAADTQVEYGATTSYGQSTTLNTAMLTSHSQNLSGLSPGTLYHYRVKSRDAAGNLAVSGDMTLTTTSAPTGLIGHWKFDEGTGTTTSDASSNGYSGTLTNGPAWTTGKVGSALNFDGANDYVNMGSQTGLRLPGSFTLAAWVYPTTLSGDRDIITKVNPSSSEYHFQVTDNKLQLGFSNGSNNWYYYEVPTTGMSLNAWSHVAGVFDDAGNVMRIYINGVAQGSKAVTASPVVGTSQVRVGMGWNGQSWKGKIDDARIYSRALSASEITALATGN
ncbi:MAG: VCBS repeat-containing protein [Candidatus Moraniibacteriota bacterium]|nr:MAG: VCBS repeat-containing protein [Candidatus Moranbacteria bacterium]